MGSSRHPRRRRRARALARSTSQSSTPHGHRYRVAAVSSGLAAPPDLILADGNGNTFLMMPSSRRLAPLDRADRDALGMFYEATLDLSWHTLTDLRRRYYNA